MIKEKMMTYNHMAPPFEFNGFENLTKQEAKTYFKWFEGQKNDRIIYLQEYIKNSNVSISLDYTPESLIPLWEWYEKKIVFVNKSIEEIEKQKEETAEFIHPYLRQTKLSNETAAICMDVAIYFAEVFVQNNETLKWGCITDRKAHADANRPVILGFIKRMNLNPFRVVDVCTLRSEREKEKDRLYNVYSRWSQYIAEK